jgi:hypothetical protein
MDDSKKIMITFTQLLTIWSNPHSNNIVTIILKNKEEIVSTKFRHGHFVSLLISHYSILIKQISRLKYLYDFQC